MVFLLMYSFCFGGDWKDSLLEHAKLEQMGTIRTLPCTVGGGVVTYFLNHQGRTARYRAAPSQIPTCGFPA